ncbi:hypothetical protein B0O80DRAFT_460877 [Mortierella sp. GBAus27b]|nr:hypothetical protein B0O80DRAFT_460877 [Mortierella sp. GBAus27b]
MSISIIASNGKTPSGALLLLSFRVWLLHSTDRQAASLTRWTEPDRSAPRHLVRTFPSGTTKIHEPFALTPYVRTPGFDLHSFAWLWHRLVSDIHDVIVLFETTLELHAGHSPVRGANRQSAVSSKFEVLSGPKFLSNKKLVSLDRLTGRILGCIRLIACSAVDSFKRAKGSESHGTSQ